MENRNPPTLLILIVLGVVAFKTFGSMVFDPSIYRGESFKVKKPEGWTMKKEKHQVTFTSPDADVFTDMPHAIFTIYAEKQKGALFMEDLFPELLDMLKKEDGDILNTGFEQVDGLEARWVLFRYNRPDIAVMSLYIADDYNRLTRIQFIGALKKFKEYGKQFEEFKASIKLKRAM